MVNLSFGKTKDLLCIHKINMSTFMALSRERKAILKGKDKSHDGPIEFRAIIALLTFILMK